MGVSGVDLIDYLLLKSGDYYIKNRLISQLFRLFTVIYGIEIVELFFRGFGEDFLKGKNRIWSSFTEEIIKIYE